MDFGLFFKIAPQVIGGLGIFLLGMKNMSEGLQAISGDGLRKMIGAVTNNRILGVGVGLVVTCLVQSSSVTTIMVVGFVNSGIMTLMQAIGVIFGANIGTTITGWILVLQIGRHGLPILGVAAIVFLFSKKERLRYIGMAVMGIGMIFFGLELMKNGFKPLRLHEEFNAWFQVFQAASYLGIVQCAVVGCILTMIVQSSSATLGITIGLAAVGVIEFKTAAALVMGENIGTTITALIASLGATTAARRTAYAHFFFNFIGSVWFIALFPAAINAVSNFIAWQTGFNPLNVSVDSMDENEFGRIITTGIALTHTAFNVANVAIFLPFAGFLAKLVTKLAPKKEGKRFGRLTLMDSRMVESPALGIFQSQAQIDIMAERIDQMMAHLKICLGESTENAKIENELYRAEEELDLIQKEIFLFLGNLASGEVSQDVTEKVHRQLRIADEYESLSDYVIHMLKRNAKLRKDRLVLKETEKERLIELHDQVANYINKVNRQRRDGIQEMLSWAVSESIAINKVMKTFRREHLKKLQREEISPFLSLIYTDMLNHYRRMKDHALNIAEAEAGES